MNQLPTRKVELADAERILDELIASGRALNPVQRVIENIDTNDLQDLRSQHRSWMRIVRTRILAILDNADDILGAFHEENRTRRPTFDNYVSDGQRAQQVLRTIDEQINVLADTQGNLSYYHGPPTAQAQASGAAEMAAPAVSPTSDVSLPTLFVGSSSESLPLANALHANLDRELDVTVWNQNIFELSTFTLEALEELAPRFDFAAFVFSGDDVSKIRGREHATVRDNVDCTPVARQELKVASS